MTEPAPELLTTTQAAALAGVSERMVRKWISAGQVGTHPGPRGKLVDRASLAAYLVERARTRAGPPSEPGTALVPTEHPVPVAELLAAVRAQSAQIAALSVQVAELRALLAPEPEPVPEPPPEPESEPGSWWARWWAQWRPG